MQFLKHVVMSLAGVVSGMAAGSLLLARVLAAPAPATVTWDATNCPAGTYTVTSTARSLLNSQSYTATSTGIQLPQATFAQQFGNLPPGQYSVEAIARGTDGQAFGSSRQTLTLSGTSEIVAAAPEIALGRGHRSRQQAPVQTRRNRGRTSPAPASSQTVRPPAARLGESITAGARRSTAAEVAPLSGLDRIIGQLSNLNELAGTESDWRRIDLIDLDADRLIDVMRIELVSGEIRIVQILR